jgi:hypothetical protein
MRAPVCMSRRAVLVLMAALAVSCATPSRPDWNPVPITDLASIRGKWSGVLLRDPTDRRDDWLEMTIGPDGAFQVKSYRLIGAMTGSGRFTLADGKITYQGPRSTITGALFTADGKRMLRMEATTPEGFTFRSDALPDK